MAALFARLGAMALPYVSRVLPFAMSGVKTIATALIGEKIVDAVKNIGQMIRNPFQNIGQIVRSGLNLGQMVKDRAVEARSQFGQIGNQLQRFGQNRLPVNRFQQAPRFQFNTLQQRLSQNLPTPRFSQYTQQPQLGSTLQNFISNRQVTPQLYRQQLSEDLRQQARNNIFQQSRMGQFDNGIVSNDNQLTFGQQWNKQYDQNQFQQVQQQFEPVQMEEEPRQQQFFEAPEQQYTAMEQ